jgi:Uma2 family endonuclease
MKAQGWLIHGAKSVWVVDPIDKLVVIHNPDQSLRELRMNDSLENDLALPGFSCQVDHFFK